MKFNEISSENQKTIKEQLDAYVKNVDYEDVDVEIVGNDKLKVTYKDVCLEIPIKAPDQATSNNIWSALTTGILIIGGVAVTLICSKKKGW